MAYKVNFGATVATAKIVELATAKLNSKIEFDEEDSLLEIFVASAASEIENYLGLPILERSNVEFSLDCWHASFNFPFPVNAINEVKYRDSNYAEKIIAAEDYLILDNCLVIKSEKPADFIQPLIIKCKAGYTAEGMPADFKRAALLIFSQADTYRENMPIKMETAAKAILRPYRIY